MRRRILLASLVASLCLAVTFGEALALPIIQRTILHNGLTLLVSEEHSLPFVTIMLVIKAGSKDDPVGHEGIAELTASALLLGASGRTMKKINEDLDYIGAHVGASANKDYTTLSLRALTKDLGSALPILLDVLTTPTFPSNELKKNIARALGAIQSSEDQPGAVAERAFDRTLYSGSPYGHPTEGTKESLGKLSREAVKRFHSKYYRPNNAILAIVGDVNEKTLEEFLIPNLEKWPKGVLPGTSGESRFPEKGETIRISKPVSQSNVIMGNGAISRDNPDYYAAMVLNHILGSGSLGSRLMEDIRNRRGLAYSVESSFDAGKLRGSFQILLQTKTSSTQEAINAVMENVERIRSELVSDLELADAKAFLVGSFPQKLNGQWRIASFMSQVEFYGLGVDYPQKYPGLIGSVTRDDVLRVAKSYLLPEKFVVVLVTNQGDTKPK
jgi:zinc protease